MVAERVITMDRLSDWYATFDLNFVCCALSIKMADNPDAEVRVDVMFNGMNVISLLYILTH